MRRRFPTVVHITIGAVGACTAGMGQLAQPHVVRLA